MDWVKDRFGLWAVVAIGFFSHNAIRREPNVLANHGVTNAWACAGLSH
ncbi:MAG: hypothetical protein AAF493_30255 [Pseudomonadota bacterium]